MVFMVFDAGRKVRVVYDLLFLCCCILCCVVWGFLLPSAGVLVMLVLAVLR